jgi:hypothetical protein
MRGHQYGNWPEVSAPCSVPFVGHLHLSYTTLEARLKIAPWLWSSIALRCGVTSVEDLTPRVFHCQLAHQVLSPYQEFGALTKELSSPLTLCWFRQASMQTYLCSYLCEYLYCILINCFLCIWFFTFHSIPNLGRSLKNCNYVLFNLF